LSHYRHALEKLTELPALRHGEPSAMECWSWRNIKKYSMLASDELESLREAVRRCGPLPLASDLSIDEIAAAMKGDKKSVAGVTLWILLEQIGRARIVEGTKSTSEYCDPRCALVCEDFRRPAAIDLFLSV